MTRSLITTITVVASVLGGVAAWASMDWPRPATTGDLREMKETINALSRQLADVSSFGFETRRMALNQDWWRIEAQLEELLKLKLERPRDRQLNEAWLNLKRDRHEIDRQIKILDRAIGKKIKQ